MKMLICGGRDFTDYELLKETLNAYSKPSQIIHGGASGADTLAGRYGAENDIPVQRVPALWEQYGKSAGYRRNVEMLDLNPDIVIAFPGGKGTKMMIDLAQKAGVETRIITNDVP